MNQHTEQDENSDGFSVSIFLDLGERRESQLYPNPEFSYLEPEGGVATYENGKNRKLMTINQRKPLDIQVDAETMERYNFRRHFPQMKDQILTICTNLIDYMCVRTTGYSFKRNQKRRKNYPPFEVHQLKEDERDSLQNFHLCKYMNFGVLRELFAYPNELIRDQTFEETTKCDELRKFAHEYFTSSHVIVHFISGFGNFTNKLKLIGSMQLIEKFPITPDSCIGLSFN